MVRAENAFACLVGAAVFLCAGTAATAQDVENTSIFSTSKTTVITTTNVVDKQHSMSGQYGQHLEPILIKIKASADQRVKITAVVTSYRPKIEPLRQEYREKSQQFVNFLVTGQPAETVMARQGELNKIYSTIVTQYGMMQLEIRKYLSPDQTRLFEQYRCQQGWSK